MLVSDETQPSFTSPLAKRFKGNFTDGLLEPMRNKPDQWVFSRMNMVFVPLVYLVACFDRRLNTTRLFHCALFAL